MSCNTVDDDGGYKDEHCCNYSTGIENAHGVSVASKLAVAAASSRAGRPIGRTAGNVGAAAADDGGGGDRMEAAEVQAAMWPGLEVRKGVSSNQYTNDSYLIHQRLAGTKRRRRRPASSP